MLTKTIDYGQVRVLSASGRYPGVGELEAKIQQCDMSADELEQ